MFKNMKLGTKLLVSFLAVGVLPFAVVGGISLYKSSNALSQFAFNQLQSMREIKKAQIEGFFEERRGDMGVLVETVAALQQGAFEKLKTAQQLKKSAVEDYIHAMKAQLHILKADPYVLEALRNFDAAFEAAGDRVDTEQWQALASKYDPRFKDIIKDNDWHNIFIIHTDGDIVYTVTKESDLGMIIPDSSLKDSGLGKAFVRAQTMDANDIAVADFEPYAPSHGQYEAFMMAQLRNPSGDLVGFVAIEVPTDKINIIMQQRAGMGVTGESYLVGRLEGKSAFRSDMKTMGDGKYVIGYEITTPYIEKGLSGEKKEEVYTDSAGNLVAVVIEPLAIEGLNWACVSKINLEEAIVPKLPGDDKDYFAKYIEKYGYYDLFLIHPKGKVFYTATREADYGTNMVDGKYADSGLGRLTRKVLKTKQYGVADFSPYAPSNNEPAAFIAEPILFHGKLELIVALQLSLDAVNGVMQQREGMGQTGETYLVGSDKLMRSDSFLDPTYHSVKASFANPAKGNVDTKAAREALSGKTGQEIIMDYNGNPVLSAYTPLKVGETTWAMIAEIDEAEAFATVKSIEWLIGIIAVVGIAAILAIALLITRSITKPINRIIEGLNNGAEQVAAASGQVSSASQQLAEGASEQAASIEETSASLEEMSSMTKQNADHAVEADNLMKDANNVVSHANDSMQDLTHSMQEISVASEETQKIIKTIDEIAFQTNLLALNAAVEAARAGEAGAGFAVVADEVRNLAMRAAEAAKNTAELIESTVKKIASGTEIVSVTNESFEKVALSASKVGELVGEIAAASSEQTKGIDQINIAVSDMDKVTQQNAANAEESASACEEMNAQAQEMKRMVDDLVAIVGSSANRKTTEEIKTGHNALHVAFKPKSEQLASPSKSNEISPDKVIPLDDDNFKDF